MKRLPLLLVLALVACGDDGDTGTDAAPDVTETTADDGGGAEDAAADASEEDGAADVEPDIAPDADADDEAEAEAADEDGATDIVLDGTDPRCLGEVALGVVNVSVDDLHTAVGDGEILTVVDVREPSETAGGIIAGALLHPWSSGVLAADHATLPGGVLYVICASGSRSAAASAFLVDNGHTCVHNVLGGMSAWRSAGYPTVTP